MMSAFFYFQPTLNRLFNNCYTVVTIVILVIQLFNKSFTDIRLVLLEL